MAEVGICIGVLGIILWFIHDYYVTIEKVSGSKTLTALFVGAIVLILLSVVLVPLGVLL